MNQQMRKHLAPQKSNEEIFKVLRSGQFMKKVKTWPQEITGNSLRVGAEVLDLIDLCNDVRGDLTHPKTAGHDIYQKLFELDPLLLIDAVAHYIVCFHEIQNSRYPYWIFGWNYLNPSPNTHEMMLLNDQQFCHSLAALGYEVPAWQPGPAELWKDENMTNLAGYLKLKRFLQSKENCEPKFVRFPFQPKLCRRWWTAEHQKTCGHVSQQSLMASEKIGGL